MDVVKLRVQAGVKEAAPVQGSLLENIETRFQMAREINRLFV